jgi:PEP-CTERM motif-containing protein
MITNKVVSQLQNRGRSRRFHIFLFAAAGALMLTTGFAPKANAAAAGVQYYFDFNLEAHNTSLQNGSLTSRSGAGDPFSTTPPNQPFMTTMMVNGEAGGNLFTGMGAGAGATVQAGGSTLNLLGTDTAGNALRLRSNTTTGTEVNCFTIGPMDFTGLQDVSISFAIKGGGTGGFTSYTLAYSFDNTSFTDFATNVAITSTSYVVKSFNLPSAVNGESTVYISACFTGSTNTGVSTATFIDNIQIVADIPEPSTYIGGLLGIAGLCWFQRRWLSRALRFRRT